MDLKKILAISGKPGLYKLLSQAKNSFIAEDLMSGKKTAISSRYQVSLLENISIFTTEGDTPLQDVFQRIYDKEEGKETLSHKEDLEDLRLYLETILPNYDKDRVYASDIKKIFQWYNLLLRNGVLTASEESTEAEEPAAQEQKPKDEKPKEKKAKATSKAKKSK